VVRAHIASASTGRRVTHEGTSTVTSVWGGKAFDLEGDWNAEGGPGGWARLKGQELIPDMRVGPGPCGETHAHAAARLLSHPDDHRLCMGDPVSCKQAKARRRMRGQGPRGLKHQPIDAHIPRDPDGAVAGNTLALTEDRQAERESRMLAGHGWAHASHTSSKFQTIQATYFTESMV
jgi:hypothetical protein